MPCSTRSPRTLTTSQTRRSARARSSGRRSTRPGCTTRIRTAFGDALERIRATCSRRPSLSSHLPAAPGHSLDRLIANLEAEVPAATPGVRRARIMAMRLEQMLAEDVGRAGFRLETHLLTVDPGPRDGRPEVGPQVARDSEAVQWRSPCREFARRRLEISVCLSGSTRASGRPWSCVRKRCVARPWPRRRCAAPPGIRRGSAAKSSRRLPRSYAAQARRFRSSTVLPRPLALNPFGRSASLVDRPPSGRARPNR